MKPVLPRILVIGAGPSGLSLLRAFNILQQSGTIAQIYCYDTQKDWSGQWNLTWRTGLGEYGQPVPNSMYKSLWTNTPKECFEFPDYSFMEHFGVNVSSYLPRQVFKSYFMERFRKADIRKFIKFETAVRYVQYQENTKTFTAIMNDLKKDQQFVKEFDFVVVASGHYSVPNSPEFKGIQTFSRKIMHSHDLRDWSEFSNKRVLIVGGNLSAEDVAVQCYKYGAKQVTVSYNRRPMKYNWPTKMEVQPALIQVNQSKCTFVNGQCRQFDIIILCTGYLHSYPFLESSLRLKTQTRFYPYLYMGTVYHGNHRMFYIGAQNQVYSMTMFDIQAYLVRDIILGKTQLPSSDIMHEDTKERQRQEQSIKSLDQLFDFKKKYMQDLIGMTGYPHIDLDQTSRVFNQLITHKRKDIVRFRDNTYKSAITGVISAKHPVSWINEFDDSYQGYMKHYIKPKL